MFSRSSNKAVWEVQVYKSVEQDSSTRFSTGALCGELPAGYTGTDSWIRFGPKVKTVAPPRSEEHGNIVLSHHMDEVGLYTEQEERDFVHISGLLHYKEQVTGTLMHAVCSQDDECDLNPLPGSLSYSLSKLEKETVEFVELGPWAYVLVKILGPIWM